ncbi:hypothetical protein ABIA39_008645 [Nocardia sp. GAS34]
MPTPKKPAARWRAASTARGSGPGSCGESPAAFSAVTSMTTPTITTPTAQVSAPTPHVRGCRTWTNRSRTSPTQPNHRSRNTIRNPPQRIHEPRIPGLRAPNSDASSTAESLHNPRTRPDAHAPAPNHPNHWVRSPTPTGTSELHVRIPALTTARIFHQSYGIACSGRLFGRPHGGMARFSGAQPWKGSSCKQFVAGLLCTHRRYLVRR